LKLDSWKRFFEAAPEAMRRSRRAKRTMRASKPREMLFIRENQDKLEAGKIESNTKMAPRKMSRIKTEKKKFLRRRKQVPGRKSTRLLIKDESLELVSI
jgi:hypothetical protein